MLIIQLTSQSKIDLFDCKCYFTSEFFVSIYCFIVVLNQTYVIIRFVIRCICQILHLIEWNFSNFIEFLFFFFDFFFISVFLFFNYVRYFVLKLFFCYQTVFILLINYCYNLWITNFKLTNFDFDRFHLIFVVVRIVIDFRRFLKFHHRWIREINENTIQLIIVIIIFNQFFFVIDVKIIIKIDFEFLNYLSKWTINIIRFRENIQIFRNVISDYRTFEIFRNFSQFKYFNSINSNN